MSYFDGNELFFFLAIALTIGFIINYLGKKIVFLEEMPLNNNGKIDKKKLKELV